MDSLHLHEFVDQYLQHCRFERGLDKKTLKAYTIDLKQYHAFLDNTDAKYSKESLQLYIVYLHEQYTIKSVKRKIASLRAYFNYLEYEELIPVNPFMRLRVNIHEPFLLPRTIPLSTIQELLHCAYRQVSDARKSQYPAVLRDIAVLELLFATGMRISELCSLKREDVSLSWSPLPRAASWQPTSHLRGQIRFSCGLLSEKWATKKAHGVFVSMCLCCNIRFYRGSIPRSVGKHLFSIFIFVC